MTLLHSAAGRRDGLAGTGPRFVWSLRRAMVAWLGVGAVAWVALALALAA